MHNRHSCNRKNKPVVVQTPMVVTEELGYKVQSNKTSTQDTPPQKWKVRLQRKIDKLKVDVSCLEHLDLMAHCQTKEQKQH